MSDFPWTTSQLCTCIYDVALTQHRPTCHLGQDPGQQPWICPTSGLTLNPDYLNPVCRLSEAERDLEAVRAQLRQHATRKRHLEDVCAQLDSPVPLSEGSAASGALIVVASGRLQQRLQQQLQQQQQPSGGAAAAGADSGMILPVQSASGEIAAAAMAASPAPAAGSSCAIVAAADGGSGSDSEVAASAPGASSAIVAAARTSAAAVGTDMEWRAQRLECLMYR